MDKGTDLRASGPSGLARAAADTGDWPAVVNRLITDSHGSLEMPPAKLAEFYGKILRAESGCWEWQGPKTQGGYGRLNITTRYWYTHRLSHELFIRRIPEGMQIDHLCRNRSCCNPAHLEAVTQRQNIMRSPVAVAAVNATKTHCPQGHEYTPENLIPNTRGRKCLTCHTARQPKKTVGSPRADVCRNGHPRTPENTLQTTTQRRCRVCDADSRRRYNERQVVGQ